jgi:hypothetical protein
MIRFHERSAHEGSNTVRLRDEQRYAANALRLTSTATVTGIGDGVTPSDLEERGRRIPG